MQGEKIYGHSVEFCYQLKIATLWFCAGSVPQSPIQHSMYLVFSLSSLNAFCFRHTRFKKILYTAAKHYLICLSVVWVCWL